MEFFIDLLKQWYSKFYFLTCKLYPKPQITNKPAVFPGKMWAITAFFDFSGHKIQVENYKLFRQQLKKQRLPLLAVELAHGTKEFVLNKNDADILIQIRGGDMLWQKERLLNIALGHLPNECDKVAWLDSDILFEDPDWIQKTKKALEQYVILQPFSLVKILPKKIEQDEITRIDKIFAPKKLHSFGYGVTHAGPQITKKKFWLQGHWGMAWAARRSLLDAHGFYDREIIGYADKVMVRAAIGNFNLKGITSSSQADCLKWSKSFYNDVKGSVGYVPGTIIHLWHGKWKNKKYGERVNLCRENNFDPKNDIKLNSDGIWEWASNKPGLHKGLEEYFKGRKEDG